MPDFSVCKRGLAAAAILAVSAGNLPAQRFDPREGHPEVSQRVHLSEGVMRTLMKNRVLPVYPKGARTQRVQGRVRLWVVIDERGLMSEVEPITWNSLLVLPALQAAKRLRFRPYFLNAEAVAVEGPITYQFTISANGTGRVSLAPLR